MVNDFLLAWKYYFTCAKSKEFSCGKVGKNRLIHALMCVSLNRKKCRWCLNFFKTVEMLKKNDAKTRLLGDVTWAVLHDKTGSGGE